MSQDNAQHDAQLIQRLRDGDMSALHDLMCKYQKRFEEYIRHDFRDFSSDAEDIVQETFIKVFKNPGQIKQSESFSSWGYRVITNHCIDLYRKKSKQSPEEYVSTLTNEDKDEAEKNREELVHQKWLFFDSIKELPIKHQTVLINRLKGLLYEQIAEQMKRPPNTIGTWIRRAVKKLKKICSENEIGWIQTNGPYGGIITVLHSTPEGILFAGTLGIGIFCSMDGGNTLVRASKGLGDMPPPIRSFTQKKHTHYAGTDGGLFYSTDSGDSWQQLTDGPISGIAIIGDTIYIGRSETAIIGSTIYPGRSGQEKISFSNDNGKSWTPFDNGLTDQGSPTLFASGTTLFAQMRRHVFRLKTGENSWTKLTVKDPSKKNVESDITQFTVSGEMAYAVTADGGLFRSTDMGDWWQSIKPQAMQGFGGKLTLVEDTVFCIDSDSADGQVFRSTDTGNTWTTLNTNLTNQSILSIATLSDKTLCVGTYNGVFRSTNGGESWAQVAPAITDTGSADLVFFRNALYTVTGNGIAQSVDGGASWGLVNNGLIASDGAKRAGSSGILVWAGAKLAVSGGKLYAATCESNTSRWNPATSGIYCWAEDENSWLPVHMNMPSFNGRIDSIDRLAVSGETFYVIAHAKIYRWRIGEDLWTDLGLRVWHRDGFAVSDRIIYFQKYDGKISRSLDEGDTWTDMSRLPKSTVKVEPKRDSPEFRYDLQTDSVLCKVDLHFIGETIYAASRYDGIFLSIDGSEAWRPITDGLSDGRIKIQLVDDTTFYGTNSHGIFRLMRGSDSWRLVAPTQHTIRSLAFDGATFFAITDSRGVFRLSLDE